MQTNRMNEFKKKKTNMHLVLLFSGLYPLKHFVNLRDKPKAKLFALLSKYNPSLF